MSRVKSAKTVLQYQAMDRAYSVSRIIDDMLGCHPGIEGDDKATEMLETMQAEAWKLYKRLGGEELV